MKTGRFHVDSKALCKRAQNGWILHLRLHTLLNVGRSCCAKFEKKKKTFSYVQTEATNSNIVSPTMLAQQ